MTKPPREVELDWERAKPDRVPIRWEGRPALDFGERAVARRGRATVHGMIGWDPAIGWVLVLDPGPGCRPPDTG